MPSLVHPNEPIIPIDPRTHIVSRGLTKREHYAGMAMLGLLSGTDYLAAGSVIDARALTRIAVEIANEMIDSLNENKD